MIIIDYVPNELILSQKHHVPLLAAREASIRREVKVSTTIAHYGTHSCRSKDSF